MRDRAVLQAHQGLDQLEEEVSSTAVASEVSQSSQRGAGPKGQKQTFIKTILLIVTWYWS
jgi:hypothetical protein